MDKILTYHNRTEYKKAKLPKNLDTICEKNEFNQSISNKTITKLQQSPNTTYDKVESLNSKNGKDYKDKIKEAFELTEQVDKPIHKLDFNNIPNQASKSNANNNKENIIVKVKKKQSKINKEFYLNENEIHLNEETLLTVSDSKMI